MTNREIIEYLKENKNNGVAFGFMPEDVREWCEDNLLETDIPFRKLSSPIREDTKPSDWFKFDEDHLLSWSKLNYDEPFCYECVYALTDDYEPKPEFQPHWEEFEIDKDGFFHIKKGQNAVFYCWYNWQKFVDDNFNNYNAFGGWLYEGNNDGPYWATMPMISWDGEFYGYLRDRNQCEITAPIPSKIRFWRYSE